MKKLKTFTVGLIVGLLLTTGVFASSEQIQARFADFKLSINGEQKTLQTKPLIYNDTSYLPVREIADLLGYDVDFDDKTKIITLNNSTSDYNSTSSEDDTLDDWIWVRDLSMQYGNIDISTGDSLIIDKDKNRVFTANLNDIQIEGVYKLKDINNPNIVVSLSQVNGRSFLLKSELIELEIID